MRLLRAETAQHHSYGRAGASKVLTGLSETWSRQQELNVRFNLRGLFRRGSSARQLFRSRLEHFLKL